MEDRVDIYYPGNTVIPPHPGVKRRNKVVGDGLERYTFTGKIMTNQTPKVCAASRCVWCGHKTDHYFITCQNCGNCQYCGMMDNVDPYQCFLCGNYLPIEARSEQVEINTA
jgi:hypothetical protein